MVMGGKRPRPDAQCELRANPGAGCALGNMGLWAFVLMIAGWFVTALGISLGAPF
jgi:hypothetical protein